MDNNFFVSRVLDTAELCDKNCVPKFLGFLTPEEASLALSALRNKGIRFTFFGGYDEAERVYLACLPDWCDEPDFPITALSFKFRREDTLSHRDFLGCLMSLGLAREKVGDILVERGRAVVFVASEIAKHIIEQITKIGRVGVEISLGFKYPLPAMSVLKDYSATAASCRLDCIICAICNVSRSRANEMIEQGIVSVNSIMCDKNTKCVANGEKITVKGVGKFIIDDLGGVSKKGRVIVKYKKYE